MKIHKTLFFSIFFLFSILSFSQQNKGLSITGQLMEKSGESIPFATISLEKTNLSVVSNENGKFLFKNIKPGKYILKITAVGFASVKKQIEVSGNSDVNLSIKLESELNELESVTVVGRTATEKANKQAYNITAIDAKKLHNTTLDLSHALDRVSGVRVRESGGVGSSVNFSLNGFTGRQVKFFIDGIPMDNFGSSFQINNIPVNIADRIEVYKGVVPISLGSDALGGAVNIITNNNQKNYLDASYSIGSFNTHRTAINAGYTSKSGFTAQLNAFQNYSDNNYKVYVGIVEDLLTGKTRLGWAKRFHDTYHNETIIGSIGVVNKKYADRLLFGVTLGQNRADVQTGNRMFDVYGERERRGNIIMPSVKYSVKDLFTKGLDVNFNANYNLGQEQTIDTANKIYSWNGTFIYKGADPTKPTIGGERGRTLYKYRNNNGLANLNTSYKLNDRHSFVLNGMYSTFNRKGKDELLPQDENISQPRKTQKAVFGLGYRFDTSPSWNTTFFLKQYFQNNTTFQVIEQIYYPQESKFNNTGYGLASTYFLKPNLQLKASYEQSYRLPENEELFGDVGNVDPNFSLKPESSHNFNVGIGYVFDINEVHNLAFDANVIYRLAKDFIRPIITTVGTAQLKNGNLRDVTNLGFDGEVKYSYKRIFNAGINLTYQNIRNTTKYESSTTTVSPVYKDRIPNMPFLFGNGNASVFFNDFGRKGNSLSVGYNLLYVHAFYLRWASQGDKALGKDDVPTQFGHDANITYTFANGKYNIAIEGRNLADNLLYDNFSLQKPSRSFSLKFRYFITNKF